MTLFQEKSKPFNPHTYRLPVRGWVQLRRITFRAVHGYPELLLFSALNLILLLRIVENKKGAEAEKTYLFNISLN